MEESLTTGYRQSHFSTNHEKRNLRMADHEGGRKSLTSHTEHDLSTRFLEEVGDEY